MRYHPHTPEDVQAMLDTIGAKSVSDLYRSVPERLRLGRDLDLPPALDEIALFAEFRRLAGRNETRHPPFAGAGAYPHHVPPVVDQLLLRGEFFTAYTPYQPEVSQGTLQALFEWQTFVCLLTGLEVANASMYDGANATAEAALMASRITGRRKVVVSGAVHPEYRKVLATYLRSTHDQLVTVPFGDDGRTDLAALERAVDAETACVLVGYPNFLGVVDALPEAAALAKRAGALTIAVTAEAVSLGLLQAPGALGADVAVGTFQSFGNPLQFGGPAPGFFAAREAHLRQLPGRIAGATVDKLGRRGFVLTLSTREQHIRREKATSNICTNAGLCALAATIHLSLLGRRGLSELARLNHGRARLLREAMAAAGFRPVFSGPFFNEQAFDVGDAEAVVARLARRGIVAGAPLGRWYPEEDGSAGRRGEGGARAMDADGPAGRRGEGGARAMDADGPAGRRGEGGAPPKDPGWAKGALLCVATELHTPELIGLFAQAVREAP